MAALVCTRWRTLTHSPPLLGTVEARIRGTPTLTLRDAADAFNDWFLDVAAPHVERLHLVLPYDHGAYEADLDDVSYALSELVETLALAVERGLRLQDLRLEHEFQDVDLVSLRAGNGIGRTVRLTGRHMAEPCA